MGASELAAALGSSEGWLRELRRVAAFLIAYVALDWLSFIHEYPLLPITPWQPGIGVGMAVLLRYGPIAGLWLFLGVLAAEWLVRHGALGWAALLPYAAIIATGYALAAAALGRAKVDPALNRLRDILLLLAICAVAAVAVGLANVALLLWLERLPATDFAIALVRIVVGDLIGIAVVTPMLLRRWGGEAEQGIRRPLEIAGYVLAIALALWIVFGLPETDEYKFFYLLFLPLVAIAVRFGLDGACRSLLGTQIGMLALVHWRGFQATTATEFQILLLTLTVTGLVVGIVVTERRRAELRLQRQTAELAHMSRVTMLGEMATAVAHELNQPMTAMRAYTRAAERLLSGPEPKLTDAEQAMHAAVGQADHAAAIVRRLRDFMRKGQMRRSTVEIAATIEAACAFLRREASLAGIELRVDCEPGLPTVQGDRVQLQQVLVNLIRNALDAVQAAGRPAGGVQVDAKLAAGGSEVAIAVRDTGTGIPVQLRDKLFEPFATTKPDGIGLGLSISRTIVAAHGGALRLVMTGPEGSEFRFTLPVVAA
jgi:two-component system sensor kinase FixL